MSGNAELIRQARRPQLPLGADAVEIIRLVEAADRNPAARVGLDGPRAKSLDELALEFLEKNPKATPETRAEVLTYLKSLEEMRVARRRLTIQVLITGLVFILCVIVLVYELRREEVRKEWLTLASGLIGTVIGYWLR